MALKHSSGIVTENLICNIDAENKKATYSDTNILAQYPWYIGTGSETFYGQNGDGNSRISDSTPFGSGIVWDVSNQDATSDADGGWNSSTFPVDQHKLYRFSVWIRRKVIGNGSTYLGVYGMNSASSNIGVRQYNSTGTTTNPYFRSSGWWGSANSWYLVVGHVHPYGTGILSSTHEDSGIYDTNGNKITSCTDYVWLNGTSRSVHRSYLYYSTDTATNQQFWQPRVDVCDGKEPSIKQLIDGVGAVFDTPTVDSGLGRSVPIAPVNVTWEPRYGIYPANFKFEPSKNPKISLAGINLTSGGWTVESWVKYDSVAASYNNTTSPANLIGSNTITYNSWYWSVLNSKLALWNISPGIWKYGSTTLQTGQYYHIVLTCSPDGTRYQMYLNGQAEGGDHVSYSWNPAYSGLLINHLGHGNSSNLRQMHGDYNIFRAYNRVLSPKEIKQNYNAVKGRFGLNG